MSDLSGSEGFVLNCRSLPDGLRRLARTLEQDIVTPAELLGVAWALRQFAERVEAQEEEGWW